MNIFLTGQCTLHWGRMEFGNIGNYYILEPLIRFLHKKFPNSYICTTFQLSESFCSREKVTVLPMEYYYGWDEDISKGEEEYSIAMHYSQNGELIKTTPFIAQLLNSDLYIDFSGDIWGENADFLGADRFQVGLYKDKVAQLLGKKTAMICGSPGPIPAISEQFAKEVYSGFDLVTNREPLSTIELKNRGFDISKTKDVACPAFCFEPSELNAIENLPQVSDFIKSNRPKIGIVICGWNFLSGPFDKWPRDDADYLPFVNEIEVISSKIDADFILMSHSNGFPIPPAKFQLQHGRDYPIIKQLHTILEQRGKVKNVKTFDGVYDAWQTKAIIGQFDLFISGRVHAAVAALSQHVPTVIIDYGHEPKAHKLRGFADVAEVTDFVADPQISGEISEKTLFAWNTRRQYTAHLQNRIPKVKEMAESTFNLLKDICDDQ